MVHFEEDQFCVITGCIARKLLPRPSFTGQPQTREQMYELTIPYAKIMATRMKGIPLLPEHEENNGAIGTIIHSWVTDDNQWYMKAVIDRKTRSGNDMIKALLDGPDNPLGMQCAQLSLGHQGLEPLEVSMVFQGAREGSTVEGIECVTAEGLEAIKNQEYKVNNLEIPEHFPADTPKISASMSTYTAVRNTAPPVTYASTQFAPTEAVPILDQVNQMRQQNQQMQQHQPTQPTSTQAQPMETEEDEASLLKKLSAIRAKQPQQPPNAAQQQFTRLTEQLQRPAVAGDPNNTGNIHTLHSNPEDDKLMAIASVFEGNRNFLTKDEKAENGRKLLEVAQTNKSNREALAAAAAEVDKLKKHNEELEKKVQYHEGDLEQQRKQTAAMLKKVMKKMNPTPTQLEEKELDSFESEYASGKTDRAMKQLSPFIVRASALLDAADAAAMRDPDMQASTSGGNYGLMSEMQKILNPTSSLVQASYSNGRGMKRGNEMMNAAPSSSSSAAAASSSSGLWQDSTVYMHPGMKAIMQQMDASGEDKIRLQDLQASKFGRR